MFLFDFRILATATLVVVSIPFVKLGSPTRVLDVFAARVAKRNNVVRFLIIHATLKILQERKNLLLY